MQLKEELMLKRRNGWACKTVRSAQEVWYHLAMAARGFTARELVMGKKIIIIAEANEKKEMKLKISLKGDQEENHDIWTIERTSVIFFFQYSHDSMVRLMREVMCLAKKDGADVSEENEKWEFAISLIQE